MNQEAYENAIEAVKTILSWIGENPKREGLLKTPERFLRSLTEQCQGTFQDPKCFLEQSLIDITHYDGIVTFKDIPFESLCEHHLAPFVGRAQISYMPHKKIVGFSKIARVVDVLSQRLQLQERLTLQIAETIEEVLQPQGIYVSLQAEHHCMVSRGIKKRGSLIKTYKAFGIFQEKLLSKTYMDF